MAHPSAETGGQLTVDVLALVLGDLANLELTVGGLGSAVTAGKVVDDDTEDLLAGGLGEGGLETLDVLDGVEPHKGTDLGNLLGLLGHVGAHGGDGGLDLTTVVVVGMELVLLPHVGLGVEADGGGAGRGLARLQGRGRRGGGDGRGGKGQSGGLSELHVDRRWDGTEGTGL